MIVSIRDLNSFGNMLRAAGNKEHAKWMHEHVQIMLEQNITELDIETVTAKGKETAALIEKAQRMLAYHKEVARK